MISSKCETIYFVARQEGPSGYKAISGLFNDTYTNNFDVTLAVYLKVADFMYDSLSCSQTGGPIWVQSDEWVINDTYANNFDVTLAVYLKVADFMYDSLSCSQTGGSIWVQGDEWVV